MTTLDALMAEYGSPAFVKIDVEGWEINVLRGLSRPVPLLSFEFHAAGAGFDAVMACIDRLREIGGSLRFNRTPPERWALALPQWLEADEFAQELRRHVETHTDAYGDVLVRMGDTAATGE